MPEVDETRREFGRQGYVVMPRALSDDLLNAANQRVDELLIEQRLPEGHRGHHSYWLQLQGGDPLLVAVIDSFALGIAESLTYPRDIFYPTRCQLAISVPPDAGQPDGPLLDGLTTPDPDGRPGTYTLLLGVLLSDQPRPDMGNLWVWPGSHLGAAAYFAEHGPDKLIESAPYPPIELPEPGQVLGHAGDVFLAHYLLGRNFGGNTSDTTGRVAYFRLISDRHKRNWQQAVQDPFYEFESVRKLLTT